MNVLDLVSTRTCRAAVVPIRGGDIRCTQAPDAIRANAILPGSVDTPLLDTVSELEGARNGRTAQEQRDCESDRESFRCRDEQLSSLLLQLYHCFTVSVRSAADAWHCVVSTDWAADYPSRRFTQPAEIADLCLFLCSERE